MEMLPCLYLKLLKNEKEKMKLEHRREKQWRILREKFRINSMPEKEFVYKYRMNCNLYEKLCEELTPLLPREKIEGLKPSMKVLIALNFFGWGRLKRSTIPLGQLTISRCIQEVVDALNTQTMRHKYIKFPETEKQKEIVKKKFYDKYGFPDVIGCIGCTNIAIITPKQDKERYLNHKKYYSLLTQIVCDSDCLVLHVDPSHGGAEDMTDVWLGHVISDHLLTLENTAYLLGDIDYPLEDNLMIPVKDAKENSPESRYNEIHKTTFSAFPETIYRLKARWRCLLSDKELHMTPEMSVKIVKACCVLHNMCIMDDMEAPLLSERDIEEEQKRQEIIPCTFDEYEYGLDTRMQLIEYFEAKRLNDCVTNSDVPNGP